MLNGYKTRVVPAGWTLDGLQNWVANMRLFNGKSLSTLALVGQVVIGLDVINRDFDVFEYINPLIGTANGGRKQSDIWGSN
jgi:hypothetical protein